MSPVTDISPQSQEPGAEPRDRKAEHIEIALDEAMQVQSLSFDAWVFEHEALPEIDLAEIDTSVEFLGKRLEAPFLISCMTGGTGSASEINRNLAAAAERRGIAVGVGSQRKALEDPSQAATFQVRDVAPTVPLLANLGAVQLNYGYDIEPCRAAVEMIAADALVFHLNPLQEAIQPEGDTNFKDLLPKMAQVVERLGVPVIAKEVGSGLSAATARKLRDIGIRILDTAGVGGTSWARIEARRANDVEIGEMFADWGLPTPESIRQVASVDGVTVIGSGGLRSGIDAAKALALGADLAGMAYPFLQAATESPEKVMDKIDRVWRELKIAMFCVGARTIDELKKAKLSRRA